MKVAVAVIVDHDQRFLITRRPYHVSHGGLWEFPGGKVEAGEEAEHALSREIFEETGLTITNSQLLGQVHHHYPNKEVTLVVFLVRQFIGLPTCREGQIDLCWVTFDQLTHYTFPEANYKIVQLLKSHHPSNVVC